MSPLSSVRPALGVFLLIGAVGLFLPEGRVLTPEGLRPRSSVHQVEGQPVEPGEALFAEDLEQGWISFTWWKNDTSQPLRSFSSTWTVPPPPSTRHRQTLFLFNGLQNSGPNYGILQPVLQWGPSAAGGGDYWTVASWYVTSRGQAFHTPLQRVQPGDVLVGEMQLVAQERGKFSYSCEILGMPRTRLLLKNVAELNWSTESMEAYNVRRCSDYPAARELPFTSIRLRTDVHPTLRWNAVDRVTDCDQHAEVVSHSSTDGQVDLRLGR